MALVPSLAQRGSAARWSRAVGSIPYLTGSPDGPLSVASCQARRPADPGQLVLRTPHRRAALPGNSADRREFGEAGQSRTAAASSTFLHFAGLGTSSFLDSAAGGFLENVCQRASATRRRCMHLCQGLSSSASLVLLANCKRLVTR